MDEDFPKDHIHQRVEGLKVWGEATFQGWIVPTVRVGGTSKEGYVVEVGCG